MHATLHFARRIAGLAAVLAAVSILAGCDLATIPGTSSGDGAGGGTTPVLSAGDSIVFAGVSTAVDTTDLTAALTIDSDTGDELWAALAPGAGDVTTGEHSNFRREVTSSKRTYEVTTAGDTATVLLQEDRTGILRVRVDSITVLARPFTDHGQRTARAVWVAGFRPGHDSTGVGEHGSGHDSTAADSSSSRHHELKKTVSNWKILSSTVLDRWSTSVAGPVQIVSIEMTPEHEPSVRIDNAGGLISADQWPRFPSGRTVAVVVKIAGGAPAGTQVVLHDRFEKHGRRIGLVPDASDPTTFRGAWRPSSSGEREHDWRRLLTVDVMDGTTLSADASAAYNSHQWVIPVAFNRPGLGHK